jgi:hypothetical protein
MIKLEHLKTDVSTKGKHNMVITTYFLPHKKGRAAKEKTKNEQHHTKTEGHQHAHEKGTRTKKHKRKICFTNTGSRTLQSATTQ